MRRWLVGGFAAVAMTVGMAAPVQAGGFGFGINVEHGKYWCAPVYETVCRKVYCEPCYETVCRKVWHEACYEDVCRKVWCPAVTCEQPYTYCDPCGRHLTGYRTVVVTPGYYK